MKATTEKFRIREGLTLTIGREVLLDPMVPGATNPTIPELAASETATRGTIVGAKWSSISERRFARVVLDRPGSSNHRREVLVDAFAVSDERIEG